MGFLGKLATKIVGGNKKWAQKCPKCGYKNDDDDSVIVCDGCGETFWADNPGNSGRGYSDREHPGLYEKEW